MKYMKYKFGFTLINYAGISYICPCSRNLRPIQFPASLLGSSYATEIITFSPGIINAYVERLARTPIGSTMRIDIRKYLHANIMILTSENNFTCYIENRFKQLHNSHHNYYHCIERDKRDFPIHMTAEHIHAFAFYKSNVDEPFSRYHKILR